MNIFLFLFLSFNYRNKYMDNKLMFELGNSNDIIRSKKNITSNINLKNQDAALIPLKDIPRNKPLW